MLEHHRRAVDDLVQEISTSGAYQAVILTGSLAQDRARPDSDVDVYLLVDENEYVDRKNRRALEYQRPCDYDGGYVDGKIVSKSFLEKAERHGSEPTRASFQAARVMYSSIGELQPLVDQISRYPEENRSQNIIDFFGHFLLHAGYFVPSARKRDDPFLLHYSVSHATFYAGRLLLAHNRELFPCPKQMLDALRRCASLPEGFVESMQTLLRNPEPPHVRNFADLVLGFRHWEVPQEQSLTRFMELDEWSWLDGEPSLAQR